MTPLEEKITETAETFKNQKIMEGLPRSAVRNILESIAIQAVEEWKKENLCLDCVRLYDHKNKHGRRA